MGFAFKRSASHDITNYTALFFNLFFLTVHHTGGDPPESQNLPYLASSWEKKHTSNLKLLLEDSPFPAEGKNDKSFVFLNDREISLSLWGGAGGLPPETRIYTLYIQIPAWLALY